MPPCFTKNYVVLWDLYLLYFYLVCFNFVENILSFWASQAFPLLGLRGEGSLCISEGCRVTKGNLQAACLQLTFCLLKAHSSSPSKIRVLDWKEVLSLEVLSIRCPFSFIIDRIHRRRREWHGEKLASATGVGPSADWCLSLCPWGQGGLCLRVHHGFYWRHSLKSAEQDGPGSVQVPQNSGLKIWQVLGPNEML